jgi:hypothetical protein
VTPTNPISRLRDALRLEWALRLLVSESPGSAPGRSHRIERHRPSKDDCATREAEAPRAEKPPVLYFLMLEVAWCACRGHQRFVGAGAAGPRAVSI